MGVAGLRKNVTENGKQEQQKIFNDHHQKNLPIICIFTYNFAHARKGKGQSPQGEYPGNFPLLLLACTRLHVVLSCFLSLNSSSSLTNAPSQMYVCSNLSICIAILVSNSTKEPSLDRIVLHLERPVSPCVATTAYISVSQLTKLPSPVLSRLFASTI